MSIATVKLSSKGQVIIPKETRTELGWKAGTELLLMSTGSGIILKAKPKKTGRSLKELVGMLHHEGAPISTEILCEPVNYRKGLAATLKDKVL